MANNSIIEIKWNILGFLKTEFLNQQKGVLSIYI